MVRGTTYVPLVYQLLYPDPSEPFERNDCRVPSPWRGQYSGCSSHSKISLAQQQRLAAVIHLCGLKRGETFATQGFRATAGDRCGTHSLQRYLIKVDLMKKRFARLRGTPI